MFSQRAWVCFKCYGIGFSNPFPLLPGIQAQLALASSIVSILLSAWSALLGGLTAHLRALKLPCLVCLAWWSYRL